MISFGDKCYIDVTDHFIVLFHGVLHIHFTHNEIFLFFSSALKFCFESVCNTFDKTILNLSFFLHWKFYNILLLYIVFFTNIYGLFVYEF